MVFIPLYLEVHIWTYCILIIILIILLYTKIDEKIKNNLYIEAWTEPILVTDIGTIGFFLKPINARNLS